MFLSRMSEAVSGLEKPRPARVDVPRVEAFTPAVSVRRSLADPDHIVSMIDGRPYRTLRRHLAGHGLTPDEYRTRYNLKADCPMVAAGYSEARRAMAKRIGLGRKPVQGVAPGDTGAAGSGAPKRRRGRATKVD